MIDRIIVSLVLSMMLLASCHKEASWENLIANDSLENWEIKSGSASYSIKDGVVTGVTKSGTPNTFLCTKKQYGDFILTYDVWVDPAINSGVQIRSEVNDKGRVFGYQVELDPSERAYSGGIYDEGRRAWLYPLSRNQEARSAFKKGEWNHFRIEAIGDHIYTWVNDVPAAHIIDDLTHKGIIGLQVHAIYKDEDVGKEIKWKNIKISTDLFDRSSYIESHHAEPISFLANELSNYELDHQWAMIWNGKNTEGWIPSSEWNVVNGALKSSNENEALNNEILTEANFENFILEMDFALSENSIAGIVYKEDTGSMSYNLSNIRKDDQLILAGLGTLIDPVNLSIENRGVQYKGDGNYNQLRIIVNNNKVEHWLNGEKMVDEELEHDLTKAPIKIYNRQGTVSFRNIKIKEL